jgi:TP901 family phage tail tape measure protein
MSVLAELFIRLGLDDAQLQKGIQGAQNKIADLGSSMTAVGRTLTLGVTVPLVAAGAGALKMANDYDAAVAAIRAGTGATGDDLAALEASFKSVYTSVPQGMDEVSQAIADLNTRLGLTGEPLERMAKQMLDLARLTGTDVATVISSSTRLFGDWSIATEDQGVALDYLFKVSQTTGIGLDQLNSKLVQYGAPLRQMGFDFETAAALMGKFEKEGVNTELVLGSLRIALGTMAREGITDATEALQTIIGRIRDAGTASEANAIALEMFGSRAGPDMAAAIREGRFELDGLLQTLSESPETIAAAAEDTLTFGDSLTMMKQEVALALVPLGHALMGVFEGLRPLLTGLIGVVTRVSEAFASLPSGVQSVIVVLGAVAAAVGPALMIAGKVTTFIAGHPALLLKLKAALLALTGPVGAVILAVGALIAVFVYLYKTNEDFREKVNAAWDAVKGAVTGAVEYLTPYLAAAWEYLKAITGAAWEGIRLIVESVAAAITWIWDTYGAQIVAVVTAAWNQIRLTIETALGIIRGVVQFFTALFRGDWKGAWDAIKSITEAMRRWLSGTFGNIRDAVLAVWQVFTDALGRLFGAARDTILSIGSAIWNGLRSLPQTLYTIGRDAVQGLIDGLRSLLGKVKDVASDIASSIAGKITGFFDIGSPSRLMFGIGKNITEGLELGIRADLPDVDRELRAMTEVPSLPRAGGVQGAEGPVTVTIAPVVNVHHRLTAREYADMTDRWLTAAERALKRRGLPTGAV